MGLTQSSVAFHKLLTFSQAIYIYMFDGSYTIAEKRQLAVLNIPILNKS